MQCSEKKSNKTRMLLQKYFNPLISQQHLKSQRITELHKNEKKKKIKNTNQNKKNIDKKHKSNRKNIKDI